MAMASVRRDADALVFTGALTRAAAAPLWQDAVRMLDGVRRFDLAAVERVDSAGLALLGELAAGIDGVAVSGEPTGLPELRRAYRLSPSLSFATT
ncbi:STAS domain-containing protein [Luteimonas aestuarii]|uniref:STAS domain-containing protein n=2 Tax=Luteimonas aestuarii TaxID=453837 RepID=A0A4R5TP10_9GAMM|nr:STAS domain-containing protein [Luteimonas aestuarii]TDK23756.1 STAS domain-containing protein [Luteimonas aestuarii]